MATTRRYRRQKDVDDDDDVDYDDDVDDDVSISSDDDVIWDCESHHSASDLAERPIKKSSIFIRPTCVESSDSSSNETTVDDKDDSDDDNDADATDHHSPPSSLQAPRLTSKTVWCSISVYFTFFTSSC